MRKPGRAPAEPAVATKVRVTGQTVYTAKTSAQRIHGDSLTDAYFSHAGADLDHFSGDLMSEHQGFADFEIQDSAFMIIVQVGSADSSGAEPHQYLAILRARLGAILNFELFGSVNDTSDHRGVVFGVLEGVSVSERMWVTRASCSVLACIFHTLSE